MKGMSKIYGLAMAYAMMGTLMPPWMRHDIELTEEQKEYIKKIREEKAKERKLQRGLKEWNIDGIKVIALNEKNAIRKANKIKKLMED